MNQVMLIGHLGTDPELRYTGSGTPVSNFRMATNTSYRDASGETREDTQWHAITVWGKTAENCAKYLQKGRQVQIEGRLRTRKWVDREGNNRFTTEVVGRRVTFLGGRRSSEKEDQSEE